LSLSYTSYPVMLFLKSQIKSPQKEKWQKTTKD
jgi:hypothetical protein